MTNRLTALLILHNEEKTIKRALDSIRGVVDEIFVIHDGTCTDDTLNICKKYTDKIFVRPRKKRASLQMIFAFNKIETDWILKLDADEFLSDDLRKNLKILINDKSVDAYSFLWRWWDGKKYITKNFPHKMVLFKKSKISFLEFPGNDEPEVLGNLKKVNFSLEHRPTYNNFTWENAIKRGIPRAKDQAVWTMKDFDKLKKYNYHRDNFKLAIKLRRNFTLLSMIIFPTLALIKIMKSGYKEGIVVLDFAIKDAVYQASVCYYILKLKWNGKI